MSRSTLLKAIVGIAIILGGIFVIIKDEPAAPHYSAGYGLFFGGALQFWKLLIAENQYENMSSGDMTLITLFGLGSVLFLGGAGMWIAYAIKENGPKNGVRISGRLAVLYVILQYLYASGLEHVHYGMHDLMVIIASLMAFLVVSGALFHQGYLRLPKIAKND